MRNFTIILLISFLQLIYIQEVAAFWVWTPDDGKWIDPKYVASGSPERSFEYAKTLYDSKDYDQAIKGFELLVESFPLSNLAGEAQYYIGRSYEGMRKHYYAYLAYQKVIDEYPGSQRISEVIAKEYEIADFFYNQERAKILGKSIGMLSSREKALEIFQKIVEDAPYGEYGPLAQYKIGIYYKDTAGYKEAIDEFNKVIDNYPQSRLIVEARYEIAICLLEAAAQRDYKQADINKAIREFQDFITDYPQDKLTAEAVNKLSELKQKKAEGIFSIAQFYEKQGDLDSALIYYKEIRDSLEDTSLVIKAVERILVINKGRENENDS